MLGGKDYKEICKEIDKLETNHPDGSIDYNTCNRLHVLYQVKRTQEKEEAKRIKTNVIDDVPFGKIYSVEDEDDNKDKSDFMRMVEIYGSDIVLKAVDEYLKHEKRWNPVSYSMIIDSLKEKC